MTPNRPTCIAFTGDVFETTLECGKNAFVRNYRGANPVHGWLCFQHYAEDVRPEKPRRPSVRYVQPGKALMSDDQIISDILRTERVALAQALYDTRVEVTRCGVLEPLFLRTIRKED